MKIGEKIANLRTVAGMSQEQLAEILDVSRQSVSKWEMDQALPQLDKVIQLCEFFKISTDVGPCTSGWFFQSQCSSSKS